MKISSINPINFKKIYRTPIYDQQNQSNFSYGSRGTSAISIYENRLPRESVSGYHNLRMLNAKKSFTPAKTIEEAKRFAKSLGIDCAYELEDLETANYVNEAMSEFYKKTNRRFPVIKGVVTFDRSDLIMGLHPTMPVLMVNENAMKNIDETIKAFSLVDFEDKSVSPNEDLSSRFDLNDEQKELIQAYFDDSSKMPLKDKLHLALLLRDIRLLSAYPPAISYNKHLRNPETQEFLEKNGILIPPNVFACLPLELQTKLLSAISSKGGFKLNINDGGSFSFVNHELGHKLHLSKIGREKFDEMAFVYDIQDGEKTGADNEMNKGMQKFIESEPNWFITTLVSPYSGASPAEFVAETYSMLLNNVELDNSVIDLYRKYDGPEIGLKRVLLSD